MVLVLLKNRVYNRGGVDAIIHGLKNSKTAAQLASPQEHEIYKRQCEMLEQIMVNGSVNANAGGSGGGGSMGAGPGSGRGYHRSVSWDDDRDLFDPSTPGPDADAAKVFSSETQVRQTAEELTYE